MVTSDRRRKLTIEEVNVYWRALKEGTETVNLHKICNAIRTLDMALNEPESTLCSRLSGNAWSRQRDDYFDFLIASFAGYFVVFPKGTEAPLDLESDWPAKGVLDFYPQLVQRRDDSFRADLERIHESILVRLRWCFAEGRHQTTPEDFARFLEGISQYKSEEQREECQQFLDRHYQTCAAEVTKLKKIAHRKLWQLQSQVSGCKDSRQKSHLRRQMQQLELVWGPSC